MDDFARALLVFFVAVNPAAAVQAFDAVAPNVPRRDRALVATAAGAIALALLALAAALRDPLLDFLALSDVSFDLAAGLVMVVGAVRVLWHGRALDAPSHERSPSLWRAAVAPLAVPVIAGPATLAATVAYVGRYDAAPTLLAAAAIIVLTSAAATSVPRARRRGAAGWLPALAAVTAALLMLLGFGLGVDGIRGV
jgi:multiple antibiotic resistance protein